MIENAIYHEMHQILLQTRENLQFCREKVLKTPEIAIRRMLIDPIEISQ
jgi:hypothetical protein